MATPGVGCAATPRSAKRRSARRSWFETPPATKLEFAVEKPVLKTMSSRTKRRSIDDVETLVLSHFTKPPRISFGKIIVGRSKTRVLLVQNTADYEQEVLIERFPYKKCFNVDQTNFVVGPGEVVTLTLTWTPQDGGGCREMILFHINEVYRLQAYVFGTAEDPKPVKKGRKGMLGTRRQQPPSSVVHTKSLKSISDNYSPRKSDETRELRSKARPVQTIHVNQENLQPADLEELPPQTPPPLESTAICRSDEHGDQNALERRKSGFISPTLSKMSPIPMMADTNNGRVMESYFSMTAGCGTPTLASRDRERCPLKVVSGNGVNISNSPSKQENTSTGGKICSGSDQSKQSQRKEASKGTESKQKDKSSGGKPTEEGNSPVTGSVKSVETHLHVSPHSFIMDTMAGTTSVKTPEIGKVRLSHQVARVTELAKVSPNSFVENMEKGRVTMATKTSSIPSPSSVLNDSIPHDIVVRQLEYVRKSLHDSSFHDNTPPPSATVVKAKGATKPQMDRINQLAQPKVRNVFAHAQQQAIPGKKEKFLQRKISEQARFAKITDAPSPRRKTFLVKKKQGGRVSPLKGQANSQKGRKAAAFRGDAVNSKTVLDDRKTKGEEVTTVCDESEKQSISQATTSNKRENAEVNEKVPKSVHYGGKLENAAGRRRSLWASSAVEPFIIASKPDCDSTGEETHTLENQAEQSREESHASPSNIPGHCLPITTGANEDQGRRSSGRRLFSDVACSDLNISKDFKALWSGSATVTKSRTSTSPPRPGSANTSKKLFPDINIDVESRLSLKNEEGEEKGLGAVKAEHHPAGEEREKLHPVSCSGQILSEKNAGTDGHGGQSYEWRSPQQLLTSPVADTHRRATLTVTKSRPSQVLLDAGISVACQTPTEQMKQSPSKTEKLDESDETWKTETIVIETKKSVVVSVSFHRGELLTPSQLPTSPKSENSRRSTHAIRNPVVLNKDDLIPKNLFASVPESDPPRDGVCETEKTNEVKDEISSNRTKQIEEAVADSRIALEMEDKTLSPMHVFTDRTEHHLNQQREKITVSTHPAAVKASSDISVCSQEMSADSLEPELKTLSSKQDEEESFADAETGGSSKYTSANADQDASMARQIVENTNRSATPSEMSDGDTDGFFTPAMSPEPDTDKDCASALTENCQNLSTDRLEVMQVSGMHLPKSSEETLISTLPEQARHEVDVSVFEDETDSLQKTPVPSLTSAGSKVNVMENTDAVSAGLSSPPDDTDREKLTSAEPILPCKVVRETLLKDDSSSNTYLMAESVPPANQGQLRRSVSVDLHSQAARSSFAQKKPVPFTFKDAHATKEKLQEMPAAQTKSQTLGRAKSHSNLETSQMMERLNRKRTSPEAGLKEPRSKRVELDSSHTSRKRLLPSKAPARSGGKTDRAAKPSKGVALSKLILVKKSKTALPKHPLPFAARNMYYDERWQDKQERGFVHWLNFVLTPTDEYMLATNKAKVDARTIAFDGAANKVAPRLAPTKEILSFRAYAARRRLNHLRRASCRLFQSEAVVRVVCRLELEVEQRRLAVRTDRMIHADIGLKQKILDMLLSYNPLWLRIGLETVYGEVLPVQTNNDVIGMSRFILTRLLTSPDISAHYAHPTVPHLYQDGYADAVAQHLLKKFLVLVYFLDCAKRSRLITHDPCLFCKDAEIKSTKGLLIQFSRDFLSGEGDVTKHLAYMGYIVSHVQTPLDEFDYAVTNLRSDLRDGLRLGRIIMLLTGNWNFAPSLRAPAISRLQKIHNVELVFKQLTSRGFDLNTAKGTVLNPRDIVDGHREKTLAFLWKLIFHFQTMATLNEQELQEEVDMLERTLRVKLCMQRLLGQPKSAECVARRDSGGASVPMENPLVQLLLRWCRTVCLHYGVKVENFTVSFSDGRALCCLLHHYHPALLPLDAVHFRTTQSLQEAAEAAEEGTALGGEDDSDLSQDWGAGNLGGEVDQSVFDSLLANEKDNFRILYEKVSELGGIPLMLKAADMSNTIPDERVVVTYVSYMCARLLDLREETRAARIIQMAWRRFCLRRSARLRQKEIAACIVIQRAWRQYLAAMRSRRQEAAALCLQAAWRGRQGRVQVALLREARRNSALHEAATSIQTGVRLFLARQRFLHQCRSAVTIQSWFRTHRAQQVFNRQRQACMVIQTHYRAHCKAAVARTQFLKYRQAAMTIQQAFRQKKAREAERRNSAASVLQSRWKGRKTCQEFSRQRRAAVLVQAWWRGELARTQFLRKRTAASIIQQKFRAARLAADTRESFLRKRRAATVLQKHARGIQQRQQFNQAKGAAIVVQKHFRGYRYRLKFRALRLATVIVQRAVRAHQARSAARQHFVSMRTAAITIQRWIRQQRQRQAAKREAAATKIQAYTRGHITRKVVKALRQEGRREAAAVTIQKHYRATTARRQLKELRLAAQRGCAAVLLQAAFRGLLARRQANTLRLAALREQAAVNIQCCFRRYRAVKELRCLQMAARQEAAAVKIQAAFRGFSALTKYRALQVLAQREAAATVMQAAVRRLFAVKQLRKLQEENNRRCAAVRIQSAFRRFQAVKELRVLQLQARRNLAAVRIVNAFRRYLAVKTLRALQLAAKREKAARTIQSAYHRHKVAQALKAQELAALQERSAIKIQTQYRVLIARRHLQALREAARRQKAAVKLQAWVRRYLAVKTLRALQLAAKREQAAWMIQSAYRRHKVAQALKAQELAALQERSAIKIQTQYRVLIARRHLQALREAARRQKAAVKLQAWVRGHQQRQRYLAMQCSVLLMQTYVRGLLARRNFEQMKEVITLLADYQQTRERFDTVVAELQQRWDSAVAIQAAWRGHVQKRQFLKIKTGITQLQAAVRGRQQRNQYLLLRKSATAIQRRYRARQIGQSTHLHYQLMLGAAVVIQSSWKMFVIRSYYLRLRAQVIRAQAYCRGFLARKEYKLQRQAAICLQRRFRAKMLCQVAMREYRKSHQAIIRAQAMVRRWKQRQRFNKVRQSCVVIQSAVRRWSAQRHYQTQGRAVTTIQHWWRASLCCRKEMKKYEHARKALITIQSYVRGHLTRRNISRHHRAATLIQCTYRRHSSQRQFLRIKHATITLQQHVRAFLTGRQCREEFYTKRQSCITIQSAYRGYITRQCYINTRQAVVKIQAVVKGFLQRQQYCALYRAVQVCQTRYRAKCLGHVFHTAFLLIREAVIVIQKYTRGHQARLECQHRRSAIITLQAHSRGWLVRRQVKRSTQAAVCVQRWWRERCAVRQAREAFLQKKSAAITVQQAWRTYLRRQADKREQAASVLQKHYRRWVAQRNFQQDMTKIVRLQALARSFLTRKRVTKRRSAIVVIQRRWRETLLTRQCRHDFLLKLGAAVVIQSVFRGYRTRVYYKIAVQRVILLQAFMRGCVQRRRYLRLQQAVVSMQCRVRSNTACRRERSDFVQKRNSAICIQRAFRHWQQTRELMRIQAATRIQAYARMIPIRREFVRMKAAVIVLQAAARKHQAQQALQRKKSAIIFIQNRVRFFLLTRQLREAVQKRQQAAMIIQQAFRGHHARTLARRQGAACIIQAAFRGYVQRLCFLRQKRAVLTLQCAARGWKDRCRVREVRKKIQAAVMIQTKFREWRERRAEQLRQQRRAEYLQHYRKVAERHLVVLRIQRWYRRCKVVRQAQQQLPYVLMLQRRVRAFLQRVRYLRARQEAQELQVRQEKAARVIQTAVRKWRQQQEEKRRVYLITKLQAIWRGRQLRRSLKSKKIAAARKRVHEANQKATEEKKLGNRTASALDFLLRYKQLAYILDALMHLDVATRLSWVCCEQLVEVNAVGVIYRLILSCNRSLPHMELIKYSISILLNLAKYEKTASAVYEVEDSVHTLIDLMSIYREKGSTIFTKTCMLLAILGSDPQQKGEMTSDKRVVEKLQSIHALVLRKHRMQVARARAVARTSLNATLPSRLLAPKCVKVRPAWVLRRDSMNEIEDPFSALSFLLDTLHIGPK